MRTQAGGGRLSPAAIYGIRYREAYAAGARFLDVDRPTRVLVRLLSTVRLAKGARVIDMGCGEGRDAVYLARRGFQVVGIDRSAEAIGRAKQRAKQARVLAAFRDGDITRRQPLSSRWADLVISIDNLHLVIDSVLRQRHYREALRLLRPGGRYFLVAHTQTRRVLKRGGGLRSITVHVKGKRQRIIVPRPPALLLPRQGYERELKQAGFRIGPSSVTRSFPIHGPVCVIVADKPGAGNPDER